LLLPSEQNLPLLRSFSLAGNKNVSNVASVSIVSYSEAQAFKSRMLFVKVSLPPK